MPSQLPVQLSEWMENFTNYKFRAAVFESVFAAFFDLSQVQKQLTSPLNRKRKISTFGGASFQHNSDCKYPSEVYP
jgi:hypothetical protein